MLRLLQVLNLELVLVEVGLSLLEFLGDLLSLLLEHVDLLDLLLEPSLDCPLLVLGLPHGLLGLVAELLKDLLLGLHLLLLS